MKKALIVANLFGFIGFLWNDIHTLQDMGYKVDFAATPTRDSVAISEELAHNNMSFIPLHLSSKDPFSRENVKAFFELRRIIKTGNYDVVHCHTPIAGALARVAASSRRRKGKCVVIYTSHGFSFHEGASKKSWMVYYTLEELMSKFCDAIITINYEDYQNAQRMHCKKVYHINGVGFDSKKYITTTVDRDAYRSQIGVSKNALMILAIGELSERKNHQIIIKAMAKAKIPNSVFVICGNAVQGSGTYDELKALAEQSNVDLIFLGHRSDIPQICHCADIGVMPSTREGLGIASLEMLASGLPLVASNVQGIKDYMVDGKNGFMVSPYDVDGFSNALLKLADAKEREAMKENCIKSVAEFDNSISNQQMRAIYEELL